MLKNKISLPIQDAYTRLENHIIILSNVLEAITIDVDNIKKDIVEIKKSQSLIQI